MIFSTQDKTQKVYLDHLQQHQKRIRTSFIKCRAAAAAAVAVVAAVVVVFQRFFTPTFRRDFFLTKKKEINDPKHAAVLVAFI